MRGASPFLIAACLAAIAFSGAAAAQPAPDRDPIVVTALRNTVDKSYRRMIAGADLFERRHALAPAAPLRFKLLPRRRDTDMRGIEVTILGDSFELPVEVAPDDTFSLERRPVALKENASVRPNRKSQTMTWRAEIRTPGLPPGTRRLGDLRLECEVGMEAGLTSNDRPGLAGLLGKALAEGPEYCRKPAPNYLFFAERPIFGVTLVSGAHRETLSVDRLYASQAREPAARADLPYCDCEVLVDRTYLMPLGDPGWPDDTRVELEYMDAARAAGESIFMGGSTKAQVAAAFGAPVAVRFDSGREVWVYRDPPRDKAPPPREFVLLFSPAGAVTNSRIR